MEERDTYFQQPSEEDSTVQDTSKAEQHMQLSVLTTYDFDRPQTMKLMGSISNQKVVVMIDSDTTHCFISDKVVPQLQWPTEEATNVLVVLGDRSRVQTHGIYEGITLDINSQLYKLSFYVFLYAAWTLFSVSHGWLCWAMSRLIGIE